MAGGFHPAPNVINTHSPCGCTVVVKRAGGVLRHSFREMCDKHGGRIRNFKCENERMACVRAAYQKAKARNE